MSRPRIVFLFNHDAAHQVAHVAGIAAALALTGEAQVIAACGTPAIRQAARALMPPSAAGAIEWIDLTLPRWLNRLLAPLNTVAPVRRLARLDRHLGLFTGADVLVSPERTCLRIKRKLGTRAPKFVFVPHGAGDRSVTYHPQMRGFDLMLVSGQKVADEMAAHGIMPPDRCRIIGYPKFDTIDLRRRARLFANDNPVFVYNPHFDPALSSWYDHGEAILDFFLQHGDRYNLIFAPHVMLFRKKIHYSLEYRRVRIRPGVPDRFHGVDTIRIDTGSERLFDMTYTLAADGYIGDVSSQVYEFLSHRGACFFLDCETRQRPPGEPHYPFWDAGEVFRDVASLAARLPYWREVAVRDLPAQSRLFAYTIDQRSDRSASQRGADALLAFARDPR